MVVATVGVDRPPGKSATIPEHPARLVASATSASDRAAAARTDVAGTDRAGTNRRKADREGAGTELGIRAGMVKK